MFGGGLWPVVQRELRETARRPINHWLRVGGGLGGVSIFCSVTVQTPTAILGAELFHNIHVFLLCLICAFVPALAADSIARERREGTLGLLFMTPLTASGIVLGKVLAQVLRVLTLWLAVMPLLTIPFLYGGVTWADVASFLIIEVCVGMLCLAAGLLATSLTDHRAIAFIIAFLLMGAFVDGALKYQDWQTGPSAPVRMPGRRLVISRGLYYFTGPAPVGVPAAGRFGFASRFSQARILAEDFGLAALILVAALRFAGWRVEHSWQDKIPSVRQANWVRRYCTPLFVPWFARRMRRTLEWNPIAWLQQYSWKARLSKWGLCMLFLVLECDFIDRTAPREIGRLVTALLLILAAAYTFAGVNGFLQDKKSGALELILVSPLSVNQIIFGRVWGLWKQFLPSLLLLAGSDIAVQMMLPHSDFFNYGFEWGPNWSWLIMEHLEIVAIYLTLPVIATCFALSANNLFVAAARSVAVGFVPAAILFFRYKVYEALPVSPTIGWVAIDLKALRDIVPLPPFEVWILAAHAASAFWAYKYLCRSLGRRSYAF
jgi:ABC-type Na+ efflux pump permease subunit